MLVVWPLTIITLCSEKNCLKFHHIIHDTTASMHQ